MCLVPVKHQKRTSDLLELELQMFLNHHVAAGNQTWVLFLSNKCSELRNYTIYTFLNKQNELFFLFNGKNLILIDSFPLALFRSFLLCSYGFFSPLLLIQKA